jgi:hypothetical protein
MCTPEYSRVFSAKPIARVIPDTSGIYHPKEIYIYSEVRVIPT